ncbi:MAG: hypothetical protein JOS17DRAFT_785725 [Linnemannia elongata]|nr:MAG: hypothetical protein JOS17DRAFT_785725 [Linnemannia elongata]
MYWLRSNVTFASLLMLRFHRVISDLARRGRVSNANQAKDMLAVMNYLAQAQIQAQQQAKDFVARQQLFQGPIPGYSGQSNPFGFTSVTGPGWLPPSGRNFGISSSTSKQNQSKSVRGSIPVSIRPLHPGSDIQGLPSTAALPSNHHPSSGLELLLRDQPKDTQPPITHPSVPAVGQSTGTRAGKHTPTRRSQGPPRDDWFIWSRDHKSTKSIYEEYLRYERELAVKLEPTDGKSKHRGKLAQRLADDTEKHVSNVRRIAKEVELLQKRLMQDGARSKDEALLAAFEELDGLVRFRSRDGHYSCNQATELSYASAAEGSTPPKGHHHAGAPIPLTWPKCHHAKSGLRTLRYEGEEGVDSSWCLLSTPWK